MADQDLPISGKDASIQLLVNGIPQKIIDHVTDFTATARYDTIETHPLGTNDSMIDKQPKGWEGEIEVATHTGQLDAMIDLVNNSKRTRVPVVINITETIRYRNGTSRLYVYPDCAIEFSRASKRGEATKVRLPWMSGKERI